jgi:hypothetical protein
MRSVRVGGLGLWLVLAGLSLLLSSCGKPAITFPAGPLAWSNDIVDYDTVGDGKAHFRCYLNTQGRIDRLGFDRDGDGVFEETVALDQLDIAKCRHLVIVLDGFPYDVVKEFRDAKHLRMFDPPAIVIPPYPVMTDLALEDAFGYVRCVGVEAQYYDRKENKVVGGAGDYLAGKNEPYVKFIQYRASPLDDGPAYLWPKHYFEKEINAAKGVWDKGAGPETVIYFMSSACMGSRLGKDGQLACLRRVEQFILQAMYETGGKIKVTLFADHGQTNIPCTDAGIDKFLAAKGWHMTDSVRSDKDASLIRFGIETCACLNTRQPAKLVDDLLLMPEVELASYVQDGGVVVRTKDAQAIVRSDDGGKTFTYEMLKGDPLRLGELGKGKVDGRELFKASVANRAYYPDALYRIWRAHMALVDNPPDVIVSLDERSSNGSTTFAGLVKMASTHGGLNWGNSATFIMSTAVKLDGPYRSEDIAPAFEKALGRPFPIGKPTDRKP